MNWNRRGIWGAALILMLLALPPALREAPLVGRALAQSSCPTVLPPALNFTGPAVTQGQFKTALSSMVNYLGCLFGTDGTAATAKTSLGLATVATTGSYGDLSGRPTALPPNGSASGDLTGNYPGPTLATSGVGAGSYSCPSLTVDAKGRVTSASANTCWPGSSSPSGAAGGSLAGSYPNPSIAGSGVAAGFYEVYIACTASGGTIVSGITVNGEGRVTSISTATVASCPGGAGSSCFPAGSLVSMADGTIEAIENVKIGDKLISANGEVVTVLAYNRPTLGDRPLLEINGRHRGTPEHLYFSRMVPAVFDRAGYSRETQVQQPIQYADGVRRTAWYPGVQLAEVIDVGVGSTLTGRYGEIPVTSVSKVAAPANTQLYNLVVSGSHTYYVDGLLVGGWEDEADFDYAEWRPKTLPERIWWRLGHLW